MNPTLLLAAMASLLAAPLLAGTVPQRVALDAIAHADAGLTIVQSDGSERRYSPSALEELPTYGLRTTTPWRSEPAAFEGVLLKDVLAAAGLADVDAITVTAENEYAVTIPRAVWDELEILVATRVNGGPIPRRERGPIQFVIDMDSYQASPIAREDYLVWMAARIEAAGQP